MNPALAQPSPPALHIAGGVAAVSAELLLHLPRGGGGVDELPNEVTLL